MHRFTLRTLATACTAVALTACGSDSPIAPSPAVDFGAVISQLTSYDASLPETALVDAPPAWMLAPSVDSSGVLVPGSCMYTPSLSGFDCPARTVDGLTLTGSYYLYDADGRALGVPGSAEIASIRTVTDVNGKTSFTGSGAVGTAKMTQHLDMTMGGLLTGARTLNGSAIAHYDVTLASPDSIHLVADVTSTRDDLVLPAPGATDAYPTSGSVTINVAYTWTTPRAAPQHSGGRQVTTFNGTRFVTMRLTSGTGTTLCTVDLIGVMGTVCQ